MKHVSNASFEHHRGAPTDQGSKASAVHGEWLLDQALQETFPASDPISPATSSKPQVARVEHPGELETSTSEMSTR
jgi:hypothetical protein